MREHGNMLPLRASSCSDAPILRHRPSNNVKRISPALSLQVRGKRTAGRVLPLRIRGQARVDELVRPVAHAPPDVLSEIVRSYRSEGSGSVPCSSEGEHGRAPMEANGLDEFNTNRKGIHSRERWLLGV